MSHHQIYNQDELSEEDDILEYSFEKQFYRNSKGMIMKQFDLTTG